MSSARHKLQKVEIDGKEHEIRINAPTARQKQASQRVRNQYFAIYVKGGAILSAEIDNILKERGIWTDEMAEKYKALQEKIAKGVSALWDGGDLDEAAKTAFQIQEWRAEQRNLIFERSLLINNTAEGQADNMAFNSLVSSCVVYNDSGKPVFSSLEDYLEKSEETYAILLAQLLSTFDYDTSRELEKELPENEFLTEYGFLNDDLQRIDDKGRLIDLEGNLINSDGKLVDESGHRINGYGQRIDENDDVIAKKKSFKRGGKVVKPKKKAEKTEKPEETKSED